MWKLTPTYETWQLYKVDLIVDPRPSQTPTTMISWTEAPNSIVENSNGVHDPCAWGTLDQKVVLVQVVQL